MDNESPERRQLAALRAEIAQRLKVVCEQWPPELFDGMVDGLAKITLKYDHADPTSVVDRRSTDRLIGEMTDALRRSEKSKDVDGPS
jgi:hypothetical protein